MRCPTNSEKRGCLVTRDGMGTGPEPPPRASRFADQPTDHMHFAPLVHHTDLVAIDEPLGRPRQDCHAPPYQSLSRAVPLPELRVVAEGHHKAGGREANRWDPVEVAEANPARGIQDGRPDRVAMPLQRLPNVDRGPLVLGRLIAPMHMLHGHLVVPLASLLQSCKLHLHQGAVRKPDLPESLKAAAPRMAMRNDASGEAPRMGGARSCSSIAGPDKAAANTHLLPQHLAPEATRASLRSSPSRGTAPTHCCCQSCRGHRAERPSCAQWSRPM